MDLTKANYVYGSYSRFLILLVTGVFIYCTCDSTRGGFGTAFKRNILTVGWSLDSRLFARKERHNDI
jgi:hypothetical protein